MASSAQIGALRVLLALDSAEFSTALKRAGGNLDGFVRKAQIGAAAIGTAIGAGVALAARRMEVLNTQTRQIDQVLANVGNSAKTSGAELKAWADDLERRTGRAANEIMSVGANLASFGFDNATFYRALALADDMSAAWGGDVKQSLEGLARALDDPINGFAMLRKRGISLTDQQEEMVEAFIKAGNKAAAMGVVFEALEGQVKGAAEAGFGGWTKTLKNFNLAISGVFDKIVGWSGNLDFLRRAIDKVSEGIVQVTKNLEDLIPYFAIVATGFALAFGPRILTMVGSLALALSGHLLTALKTVAAFLMANPFVAIGVAITAAVLAVWKFRDAIQQSFGIDVAAVLLRTGNIIINTFRSAWEIASASIGFLRDAVGSAFIQMTNFVIRFSNAVTENITGATNAVIRFWNRFSGAGVAELTNSAALTEFEDVYGNRIPGTFKTMMDDIKVIMKEDVIGGWIAKISAKKPEAEQAARDVVQPFIDEFAKFKELLKEMDFDFQDPFFDDLAKEHEGYKKRGEQLWKETRTPLEAYKESVKELNMLLSGAFINQETYSRALKKLNEELDESAKANQQAMESWLRTVADRFTDVIFAGESLGKTLKNLLIQLAKSELSNLLFGLFTGGKGKGGSILGGLFKSFGGFFAKGGTLNAGKWGVVGENGPEIVGPGSTRQIIPMSNIGETSGGNPLVLNINAPGADNTTIEIVRAIAQQEIIPQAVATANKSFDMRMRPRHA